MPARSLSSRLLAGVLAGGLFLTACQSTADESDAAPIAESPADAPVASIDLTGLPIAAQPDAAFAVQLQVDRSRAPLDQVADQLRTRVDANPDDHVSAILLASTLLAQAREDADIDRYTEAGVIAEAVLVAVPTSTDAMVLKAQSLAARHEFAAARDVVTEILAVAPDDPAALTLEADALLAQGDVAAASATIDTLLERGPTPGLLARASRIAFLQGDPVAAVTRSYDALEAAAEIPLTPSDAAFYWFQHATALNDAGDPTGAMRALETAVAIEPTHPGSLELLAGLRADAGQLDEAITIYRYLLDTGPAADLHGALADLLLETGDADAAAVEIERGIELAYDTADAHPAERRHLVGFLVDHDPELALRLAQDDFATRQDAHGFATLGQALLATGQAAEAMIAFDGALATGLKDANVFADAADAAEAVGDLERAAVLRAAATTLLGPERAVG